MGAYLLVLVGCTGDFDRPRPVLFGEGSITGLSDTAILPTASSFAFTDNEQRLRELAYPLLLPPYVGRWWGVVPVDFSFAEVMAGRGPRENAAAYGTYLTSMPVSSETARYARLIDDMNDDMLQISRFYETARRVVDMDRKRESVLAALAGVTADEHRNALARIAENTHVINRVGLCLEARAAAYRNALQRLAIAAPSPRAVDADRLQIAYVRRIAPLLEGGPASAGAVVRTLD